MTLSVAREKLAAGDCIRLSVEDTGIGISPENVRKLFEDFNQGDPSTASKYGGTGLGLALSQTLCRLMGGTISVDSEIGRGSRFTIRVPTYIEDQGVQAPAGATESRAMDALQLSQAAR